jgi:hypothetical protein
MKPSFSVFALVPCLALVAPALGWALHEFQAPTPVQDKPTQLEARQSEQSRLEQELIGGWILTTMKSPHFVIDPHDVRGFALFHGGLLSMNLQARQVLEDFFGPFPQYYVYAGAMRYRVSESLSLQCASIMAFSNANANRELVAEPGDAVRDYRLRLAAGALTLERADGVEFTFRKVAEGEFPHAALEKLRRGPPPGR